MEVNLSKETISVNKLIAKKKELVFVEEDMIVPDSKPDILNGINVQGNICILKKDVMDGKLKIDGTINTYVMYLPDSKDDNLRALNCVMDFSQSISVLGITQNMMVVVNPVLKDLECKVINGRKISLKAGVEFDIKVYSNEEVEIINKINNMNDIQTLTGDFEVNALIGNGKTTVFAKDTVNIAPESEFAEILKVDLKLINKDIKLSYNKVLTKAEAKVDILYLTESNKIEKVTSSIPIVGFIDIQNINEENICDINYEIKNILIKPDQTDDNSIYIELEIEPSCRAYERKKINLIQDLYSPTIPLEFSEKRIAIQNDIKESVKQISLKEQVNIPGVQDGKIIDVETQASLENIEITKSKITYRGNINLNLIIDNPNSITSRIAKIPFEVTVDNIEKSDNINVETEINILNSNFNINQGGILDANIELEIVTKTSKNVSMNIIDNIEVADNKLENTNEDYDSLILYIVKKGDTLWSIAKKFRSTVEELIRMNGIENENNINIGQKIYIPKFNFIKKENIVNENQTAFV